MKAECLTIPLFTLAVFSPLTARLGESETQDAVVERVETQMMCEDGLALLCEDGTPIMF